MREKAVEEVRSSVRYSFRAAYESNAFHQFQLADPAKLSREARQRGIKCSAFASTFSEELERLDREGAFRPVLFEVVDAGGNDGIVFRDEADFAAWDEYVVDDGATVKARPYYSSWQLLYLNDAIELTKAKFPSRGYSTTGVARRSTRSIASSCRRSSTRGASSIASGARSCSSSSACRRTTARRSRARS